MRIMDVLHQAWASVKVLVRVQCAALHFIVLIILFSLMSRSIFWHFGCFSFRMWNCPRCMHIHAIDPWADPSIAMHRVVHILFLLCLGPVSRQLASIGPQTENCSKLNAIEMREEGNPTPRNSCQCHWASNAPTVEASLNCGQAWSNIAETARLLGHRVQIPGTPSPYHSPYEVITPLGFFANMIP